MQVFFIALDKHHGILKVNHPFEVFLVSVFTLVLPVLEFVVTQHKVPFLPPNQLVGAIFLQIPLYLDVFLDLQKQLLSCVELELFLKHSAVNGV